MVEKIGLQAVLDDTNFQRGIQNYISATQKAQADTNSLAMSMNSLSGRVNDFASSLAKTNPRSLELARNYEKLVTEFQQGNIGLNEAKTRIGAIQDELKDLNRTVANSEQATHSNSLKWTEFNSALQAGIAIFNQVAQVARKAYEIIGEGAEIDSAIIKFGLLAENIGTTSDALLTDLRKATRGTRSDMELMAGTGDLVALGLANTHDEAVRLSRVVGALNMGMNALTLTLTNKTTARFDTLGVRVEGFDAKLRDLRATGMDVDAAFSEAFLQQAEQQILIVGDAADTAAGQLAIFESNLRNATDEAKRQATEGVMPLIEAQNEHTAVIQALDEAIKNRVITEGEAALLEAQYAHEQKTLSDITTELTERTNTYNQSLERVNDISYLYTVTQQELIQSTERITIEYGAASNMLDFYARKAEEAEQRSYNFGKSLQSVSEDAQITSESIGGVAVELAELSAAGQAMSDTLDDMQKFDDVFAGADADKLIASTTSHIIGQMEALAKLGVEGGRTADAYDEMFLALEALDPELAQNMRNSEAYVSLLDGLDTALKNNVISADSYAGIIADLNTAIADGAEPAQALEDALGKLQSVKDTLTEEGISALEGFLPADEIADIQSDLDGLIDTADDAVLEAEDLASPVIDPLIQKARMWGQEHVGFFFAVDETGGGPGGGGSPGSGKGKRGGGKKGRTESPEMFRRRFAGTIGRFGALSRAVGDDIRAAFGDALDDLEEGENIADAMLATFIDTGRELSSIGGAFVSMFQKVEIDPAREALQKMETELEAVNQQLDETKNKREIEQLIFRRYEITRDIAEQSERIAEAEAKVLKFQEQQQQLQFLEQQIKLLDFIKDRGLDPAAILGGLQFGLDASLPDLIEAMSAAMQAIIAEANEQLGIASPSKVFENIFSNVMQTSADTIKSLSGVPIDAMSDMMSGAVSVASATSSAPVMSSSFDNRTFNMNNNVNVSGGLDYAVFETMLERTLKTQFGATL